MSCHKYQKEARSNLILPVPLAASRSSLNSSATFLWDTLAQSLIFARISLMHLSWQTCFRGGGNSSNKIHHAPPHLTLRFLARSSFSPFAKTVVYKCRSLLLQIMSFRSCHLIEGDTYQKHRLAINASLWWL
jgi:hypothetical protein